jgi:hypothetical protein
MRRLIHVLPLLCLLPAAALGQTLQLNIDRLGFDEYPRLKVYLSLTERDGTVVTDVDAGDFKLVIDKAKQGAGVKAAPFDRMKEPIYIMAVVQLSPVMEEALEPVRKGLRAIADSMTKMPNSRMGIIGYSGDVKVIVENGTAADVGGALPGLKVDEDAPAEVHMIDALNRAIDLLKIPEKGRRKLIVLFSDGIDVSTDKKLFTTTAEKAAREGIVISPIGFAPFEPGRLRSLIDLAKAARGTARGAKTAAELGPRFEALVREIRKQPVIHFDLRVPGDNQEHTFLVTYEGGDKPVQAAPLTHVFPVVKGRPPPKTGTFGCSWF